MASFDAFIQHQLALRQAHLSHLRLFFNPALPSPPFLIVSGPKSIPKSETLAHVLAAQAVHHTLVDCALCLSQRHLLTRIFAQCVRMLHPDLSDDDFSYSRYERTDNINALTSNLKRLLDGQTGKFVLVLANIDEVVGASGLLLPALARLGDVVSRLHVVVTVSTPRKLVLHRVGVPHIHWPAYTRTEQLKILVQEGPPRSHPLNDGWGEGSKDDLSKIWPAFVTTVYDTLVAPTSNSSEQFRRTCHRLWPKFVWPAVSGEAVANKSASTQWDFARLLARNRGLFQADGEAVLQDRLLYGSDTEWTFEALAKRQQQQDSTAEAPSIFKPVQPLQSNASSPLLLKFNATLLLLSSFLASHTHAKHDIVLFSRLSSASSTSRRKRRYLTKSRSGGISKTPTKSPSKADAGQFDTPSKKRSKEVGAAAQMTPKKERADRSMRAILERTSSVARTFILERLIAIYRAIHPHGLANDKAAADRVYFELGELERLRLVMRAEREVLGRRGGIAAEDLLEEKWICRASRAFVVEAGAMYALKLEGWEIE